ncbi:hypothetical protein P171DRAFT_523418 [Karstenula rhodostoma CBS 690.94]|uniref:Mid2 domain-containing protein n=1 Tax=Karstenula rhodostoma CBS 690.94 TaxID=1392251 RepID=A0A9P4PCD0_9PLEO|nr:hypothetical protein P171DRAFT_523418 [Karstenula rhodostoma CBS 690.94]
MRSSWLLFALLALVALSQAFSVEDALNIDGINAYLHHGEKRQAQGTGVSSSAEPAPSSSAAEEPSSSADEPSSTPADEPSTSAAAPSTSAPPAEPSSEEADAPSSPAQQPSQQSSSADAPATTPNAPSTPKTTTPTVAPSTRALISTEIQPVTTIVTITSNGQNVVQTSVGSRTVEHTTGTTVEALPTTQASNSSGGGLSSTNKSIIGGVVGGVGGAILLGGIALVCWRMWGKKKRVTEDDADLMAGTGSALGDKTQSSASPFQSNLEQYHNPGGRPNAAANF